MGGTVEGERLVHRLGAPNVLSSLDAGSSDWLYMREDGGAIPGVRARARAIRQQMGGARRKFWSPCGKQISTHRTHCGVLANSSRRFYHGDERPSGNRKQLNGYLTLADISLLSNDSRGVSGKRSGPTIGMRRMAIVSESMGFRRPCTGTSGPKTNFRKAKRAAVPATDRGLG